MSDSERAVLKASDLREDMTLMIQPEEAEPFMVRVAGVEENDDGSFTVTTKPLGDVDLQFYRSGGDA